jgi:hypothetical protein
VSTPDQVRGRLFPGNALEGFAHRRVSSSDRAGQQHHLEGRREKIVEQRLDVGFCLPRARSSVSAKFTGEAAPT